MILSVIFSGALPTFQSFVKKLQHENSMVHLVHIEMVGLVRELLSKFMRRKAITLSHKEILKVDARRRDLPLSNNNTAHVERKVWVGHVYDSEKGI